MGRTPVIDRFFIVSFSFFIAFSFHKSFQRLLETSQWRAGDPRPDLAGPGELAGDPGVDHGGDPRLEDFADVHADRRAPLVPGRHPEVRVLAPADLRHLL